MLLLLLLLLLMIKYCAFQNIELNKYYFNLL